MKQGLGMQQWSICSNWYFVCFYFNCQIFLAALYFTMTYCHTSWGCTLHACALCSRAPCVGAEEHEALACGGTSSWGVAISCHVEYITLSFLCFIMFRENTQWSMGGFALERTCVWVCWIWHKSAISRDSARSGLQFQQKQKVSASNNFINLILIYTQSTIISYSPPLLHCSIHSCSSSPHPSLLSTHHMLVVIIYSCYSSPPPPMVFLTSFFTVVYTSHVLYIIYNMIYNIQNLSL